ncbi:mechanosensitive ion channel family protein [Niabella ginsengisoli]|uniref:Mechanosensitive ion channel family protein n=1 Tax=Niabella ginsengisoli TaxID=522298 RepID=A0ABS9SNQ4_9BACT|nr:mechanosensitive ion channel family protein [Niabella ginsengisoli]MCH5599980.1 mechanosensitive ion channel family protein [Niabella ginsengisoli]
MNISFKKAYDIISKKLDTWVTDAIAILPNLLLACIILVLGIFIVNRLKRILEKIISRFVKHKNLTNLISSIIHLLLIGIVVFSALKVLQLDATVKTLLAGAGVITLALAFAFQDTAANFVSGVFLALQRPFKSGETIQSKDHYGVVQIVHLRHTVIRNFQGQIVSIPNKDIFQNPLINFSTLGQRRLDLKVGVSYGDDLEKVERVALEAVKQISVLSEFTEPQLFYDKFGDSSIEFSILIWFNSGDQPTFWQGRSEAIKLIKKAFDENDISIPFPIRTLDFGIKGGEKLSSML